MKYQAEDGQVFGTERECREHEAGLDVEAGLRAEVEAYVDSFLDEPEDGSLGKPAYKGRARTRKIAEVMGWIRYDLDLHPERYSVAPGATVPVLQVTGAGND